MGFLSRLFRASGFDQSPFSDYWYQPLGQDSASGIRVTPLSALQSWAVFSCDRVLSETIAQLPANVYKLRSDGGKELATDHPLYKLLHDQPNSWQTSFEWRRLMMNHLNMRGNHYSRILPGPTGPVDQLVPVHPDRVQTLINKDGSFQYKIKNLDTTEEILQPWQMLHIRGASLDGYTGVSPITLCRETVGMDIAAQDYAARFYKNDARPGLVLEHPSKLDEPAYERLRKSWQEQHTGEHRHAVAILEEGMKVSTVGMTNKDAQFLEARQFTAHAICGMFRVPPHMIAMLDRATFSNIEQQGMEFTAYTILPHCVNIEQAFQRDLFFPLPDDEKTQYFAEFNVDGLNRGDMASRYASYAIGRNWSWLSANDVCAKEGLNPIPNGDIYLQPLNMVEVRDPNADPPPPPASPIDPAEQDQQQQEEDGSEDGTGKEMPPKKKPAPNPQEQSRDTRFRILATGIAQRLVRKENAAIAKAIERAKGNPQKFSSEIGDFYQGHSTMVADNLHVSEKSAHSYCDSHAADLARLAQSRNWDSVINFLEATAEHRIIALVRSAMELTQ